MRFIVKFWYIYDSKNAKTVQVDDVIEFSYNEGFFTFTRACEGTPRIYKSSEVEVLAIIETEN